MTNIERRQESRRASSVPRMKKSNMKNIAKRILVMNGSARKDGNTDAVVAAYTRGIRETGVDVLEVRLRELVINECLGCLRCRDEQKCSFQDDMTELREMLLKSDIVVLASPVYWCEITGLLKTFIDRLYFFHHRVNSHLLSGKKAVIITTLAEKDPAHECSIIVEFYRRCMRSLGIEILDMLFYPDLEDRGAAEAKPTYLKAARQAAVRLCRSAPADRKGPGSSNILIKGG